MPAVTDGARSGGALTAVGSSSVTAADGSALVGSAGSGSKVPLAEHGTVREAIARSRIEIDQARLLVLRAAHLMDQSGSKAARAEIAMIKVVAPAVALAVIDRAVQVHGGAGVSQDTFLALAWAQARTLRIADGPDEVHLESVARLELRKHQ